ncbi:MAG: glycosyltransferase [Minisyncoccia bacterium]
MQPLRIAIVCDLVPGQAGGSYISSVRFAELLTKKGHHVILVGAQDSKQKPVSEYKGIPMYQFFSIPVPGSNRFYFQSFPSKKALKKLFIKEKIEIVHTMFPSYSCFMAKRAAKELKIPVVAHIHTQPENILIFFPKFLQTNFINNIILRYLVWFVRGAKQIICPSELGKKIYNDYDPSLPIKVISNGINMSHFYKQNTPTTKKEILFIGRFTAEKDPRTVINAMFEILKSDPEARLNLIGTGPLEKEMQTLVKNKKAENNIRFLGKVSEKDLLKAYNNCSLFILPSKVELEGMVVLEAMACGKPIIIANSETSASKYFVQNNGFLFEPDDYKDLAEKALRILNNDSLREQMGETSFRNALEYDINKSVNKLEEVYYSVL